MSKELTEKAKEKFGVIIREQLERVEQMKKNVEWTDYSKLAPIIIGVCWGDGIGEAISKHAQAVLEHGDRAGICARQQIELVRLSFHKRKRQIDFPVCGQPPPASRTSGNMLLKPASVRAKTLVCSRI